METPTKDCPREQSPQVVQVSYLPVQHLGDGWALPVLHVDGKLTWVAGTQPVPTREEACARAWVAAQELAKAHPGCHVFEDVF